MRIPVLRQIRVNKGIAQATDLDMHISIPCESGKIKSGMYWSDSFDLLIDPIDTGIPVTDFPDPCDIGTRIGTVTLNKDELEAFAWVFKAASTEITRYYLNGIYFDKDQIVTTDGHRMHICKLDIKHEGKFKGGTIMPSKCVQYLLLLQKEYKQDSVVIHIHERGFTCIVGAAEIKSKFVDGTFPDYKKVFPKIKGGGKTIFDPQDILKLKPELDVLERNNLIGKAIIFEGGKIKPSNGANDNDYEWEIQTDIPYRVGFNRKYLGDMCGGVLHYTEEEGSAVLIKQRRGVHRTGVLMPLRV